MSANEIVRQVTSSFRNWVIRAQDVDILRGGNPTCLADFIRAWAESGEGVRVCLGDFQTYLVGVIAIIDDWHTYPDGALLDYLDRSDPERAGLAERRTSKIFDPEDDLYYESILDPHWFASCTFKMMHPNLRRR